MFLTRVFLTPLLCLLLSGAVDRSFCNENETDNDFPTATVAQGQLKGKYEVSRNGIRYASFLGIPYVKTPERFQVSKPPEKWEGIREATEYGSRCIQSHVYTRKISGTEDCLFINVYSHNLTANLPVMVFVHGGAFVIGDSELPGKYLMDEDVVLVAFNYRLAALGFLSTGDGEIEGNLGMKDQVMALRWVQENIHNFGGDKSKVTIFGVSAGGGSVSLLTLSPMAKGLFHRAIAQSGSALNPWAIVPKPGDRAKDLGTKLGCSTENTTILALCLRNMKAESIIKHNLHKWNLDPLAYFAPTLEIKAASEDNEVFLSEHPETILESGNLNKVPIIYTVCSQEGLALHAAFILGNEMLRKEMNDDWLRVAPITLEYAEDIKYGDKQRKWISEEVRKFYFGDKDINYATFKNLTNLYTDRGFVHGVQNTAMLQSKHTPVYMGIFAFPPTISMANGFGINETEGFVHGDDMQFMFPLDMTEFPLPQMKKGSRDELLSKKLLQVWANFAKTGDPGIKYRDTVWAPVSSEEVQNRAVNFMNLDFPPDIMYTPFKERTKFWDEVLDLKLH